MELQFSAAVWSHGDATSWHFLSVPPELSDALSEAVEARGPRRGFGSVRVQATIGGTSWATSLFPSKEGVYVLPLKRPVRTAEGLESGDVVAVTVVAD